MKTTKLAQATAARKATRMNNETRLQAAEDHMISHTITGDTIRHLPVTPERYEWLRRKLTDEFDKAPWFNEQSIIDQAIAWGMYDLAEELKREQTSQANIHP